MSGVRQVLKGDPGEEAPLPHQEQRSRKHTRSSFSVALNDLVRSKSLLESRENNTVVAAIFFACSLSVTPWTRPACVALVSFYVTGPSFSLCAEKLEFEAKKKEKEKSISVP